MSAECKISGGCWIGLLAALLMGGTVFAQTGSVSPQASGSTTALQNYQQQLGSLLQERQTLISEGATPQQLQVWRQQNTSQFQALQQLAQQLTEAAAMQPLATIQRPKIPPNASQTLVDFLTTQANLASARAQIHNQLLQALPPNPSQAQIDAMTQQAGQLFLQQHAAEIQLQIQRAQALGMESASHPLPVPGPPVIPPNATPQLKAFLTARNALASSRAQLWNQYLNASPAVRQAAMQQWRQENASSIQQLSQLAGELSNSTPTQ